MIPSLLVPCLALILAPLVPGIINRTKAFFGGRRGQPLLQAYRDIWKLMGKGAVYSTTATWVVKAGPIVGVATSASALLLVPLGGVSALVAFPGDLFVFAGFLALGRFATILAALDTGSAFEGMGASREAWFSVLAEPALLLGLAGLAAYTGNLSLSGIYGGAQIRLLLGPAGPAVILIGAAFLLVFLAENARIPFDDPNTHLELTMIHEVMILDHGGPDLAFLEYGVALKIWVLGCLLVNTLVPIRTGILILDLVVVGAGLLVVAVTTGVIESVMARLKLLRVPQALVMASVFAVLALILIVR